MTSATERLRALLTERGVEWEDCGNGATYVEHNGEAWRFDYDEPFDQLGIVCLSGYAPEQAVAATLGRGTCRDVAEFRGFGTKTEFRCSECGYEYSAVGGFGCDYGDEPDFRYCPNCGRRCVG